MNITRIIIVLILLGGQTSFAAKGYPLSAATHQCIMLFDHVPPEEIPLLITKLQERNTDSQTPYIPPLYMHPITKQLDQEYWDGHDIGIHHWIREQLKTTSVYRLFGTKVADIEDEEIRKKFPKDIDRVGQIPIRTFLHRDDQRPVGKYAKALYFPRGFYEMSLEVYFSTLFSGTGGTIIGVGPIGYTRLKRPLLRLGFNLDGKIGGRFSTAEKVHFARVYQRIHSFGRGPLPDDTGYAWNLFAHKGLISAVELDDLGHYFASIFDHVPSLRDLADIEENPERFEAFSPGQQAVIRGILAQYGYANALYWLNRRP